MKNIKHYINVVRTNNFFDEKSDRILVVIMPVVLFILTFLYFFLFRNTLFFYQENASLFIYSGEYLEKFIHKPGGLIVYIGNFLTQAYFNNLCGSILLAFLIISVYFIFIRIGRVLGTTSVITEIFALIPSSIILVVQADYEHFIHYNLGFILVAGYFLLAISTENRYRRFIYILLLPCFYYLSGSFTIVYVLLFVCWSVIYEKDYFRLLNPVLVLLVCLITFFVSKKYLFSQPSEILTGYPLPFYRLKQLRVLMIVLSVFYILFPALVKISGFIRMRNNSRFFRLSSFILILFLLLIFSLIRSYNPDLVKIIKLENMVVSQDWNGIIRQQEESPVANVIAQYYYNLALSGKGLLCERMFNSPQDFGAASLCLPRVSQYYNRSVHFYYLTGLINEARHIAYESMVAYGYRPVNIMMLIKTELINNNFRIAEKYINDLGKTLLYRKTAEKFRKMLYKPEAVMAYKEFGEKLLLLPVNDFFIRPDDRENINLLYMSNPSNHIAFEYRLAWMLLEKDYKSAVNEIRMMRFLGYKTIPRHLEEAVIGYANITRQMPDLGGLVLRPEAEKDFFEYGSAYNLYSRNKETLAAEMKKTAGNTYWYYLQFK